MKHLFVRTWMLAAGALAAVLLAACGGGSGSPPSPPSPPPPPPIATGTVSVAMTNMEACDFSAVNLTITKLRFSKVSPVPPITGPVDPGWVDVPVTQARKINVANLINGGLEVLGQATLEVGNYQQLALVLDTDSMANTVVPSAGEAEQPLVGANTYSGITVYANFNVAAGQKTDLVFNINACHWVGASTDGRYTLNAPAMYPVPTAPNGITGFVSPAGLASHVLVTAQNKWITLASTRPDPATGEFRLSHLDAGDYNVVITADNSAASAIGSVPVSETATTAISTSASPIQLAPSKMGSISGNLKFLYVRSGITMSARQQLVPGEDVAVLWTIKQKGADPATDTYTLSNLPLAVPQYALYNSTLPLTFSASTTASPGKYTVVASGLLPVFIPVDISTGDKTGVDFTLVPPGP